MEVIVLDDEYRREQSAKEIPALAEVVVLGSGELDDAVWDDIHTAGAVLNTHELVGRGAVVGRLVVHYATHVSVRRLVRLAAEKRPQIIAARAVSAEEIRPLRSRLPQGFCGSGRYRNSERCKILSYYLGFEGWSTEITELRRLSEKSQPLPPKVQDEPPLSGSAPANPFAFSVVKIEAKDSYETLRDQLVHSNALQTVHEEPEDVVSLEQNLGEQLVHVDSSVSKGDIRMLSEVVATSSLPTESGEAVPSGPLRLHNIQFGATLRVHLHDGSGLLFEGRGIGSASSSSRWLSAERAGQYAVAAAFREATRSFAILDMEDGRSRIIPFQADGNLNLDFLSR